MQLASQTTAALQQVTRHRKTWRRKSHITDATWSLIDRKKFLFKQLKQLKRARLHTMLHACFQAWHHGLKQHESVWMRSLYHDLPGWIQLHDRATAQTMQQYEHAASQVCQAVKHEDTHYYQSLADQSANTFTVEGLTGIWKHFKALLPKNRGKQQTIQYDLGASLLQHFQQLEAGVTLAQPNLYSSCVDRNNLEIQQRPASQTYDLAELPTLVEIEDHCLLQRPHKASGPDGIPSTLCRSGATAIAPQLHAMICKSFLLGVEPLCHKGGHLCALYKHKGARDDAAAYRGILLADSFAKITHAWTRQKLLPVLKSRRTTGQLGGLPAQQTLTGIQVLPLHGRVSKAAKLSTCTLFLDLRSAFHHLLRELVFLKSGGLKQSELHEIFDNQHFDIPSLTQKLEELCVNGRDDIPDGLKQFLHDIHHQTWFQLRGNDADGVESYTCTRRGSRPGSPLADIAFNLGMADLLQDLQTFLMNNDIYLAGSAALGITIPPIAWMDDVAIPLTTTTPDELVPLVQQVMEAVHNLFRDRGLTLNLDRGKTEAVLCFRGPGADALRSQIFDKAVPPVIVIPTDSHLLSLRVVPSYKHLGAQFTMNVDITKEIAVRLGAARQAFEEMKKPIFLNKRLPVTARIQLFQSLILSRLLYGCAVWSDVPLAVIKKVEATLTAYYRRIYDIGFWTDTHISDEEFLRSKQLTTFRIFWAKHKLTYLQHIAQYGSVYHKALLLRELQTGSGWLTEVTDDLQWLSSFKPLPFETPSDRPSWVSVWESLRSCPSWKAWIKTASRKHLLQEKIAWEVQYYHKAILDKLHTAGLQLAEFEADDQNSEISSFQCHHCPACFPSHQRRALHEYRVHQEIAAERYLVQSTICGGCLRDFHDVSRDPTPALQSQQVLGATSWCEAP